MVAIVKGCCSLKYACLAGFTIKDQLLGLNNGIEVERGDLKDHVDRVAQEMGFRKPIALMELPPLQEDPGVPALPRRPLDDFSNFGNTVLPIKAGVVYRAGHTFTPNEAKFLLTRQVAELKTNHKLISTVILLIVAIASTILLLPILPIAGWFIGSFAGGLAHRLFSSWNENRMDKLAMRHSTPEVRQAAIALFERLRNNPANRLMRWPLDARIHQLRHAMAAAAH